VRIPPVLVANDRRMSPVAYCSRRRMAHSPGSLRFNLIVHQERTKCSSEYEIVERVVTDEQDVFPANRRDMGPDGVGESAQVRPNSVVIPRIPDDNSVDQQAERGCSVELSLIGPNGAKAEISAK